MKVIQVNCVYGVGSTGKIVCDIHDELKKKGIESIVCYGRGKGIKGKNIYKLSSEFVSKFNNIKSRYTGFQYNGSYFATKRLIKIIKKENPNVVHLHCINGFFTNIYKLLDFLKYSNIKTILTLHAEFMYTGNCGHSYECSKWKTGCNKCENLKEATNSYFFDFTSIAWGKMKKSFDDFSNIKIVSVSPWLEERAKQSDILGNKKHYTIFNGIETKRIFKLQEFDALKLRHKIKDEKIILHVTANFKNKLKGGQYIIELAKRLVNQNVRILVVGNNDRDIILPNNVINIGRVENQKELARYYSMANLTVITSKRETFSMVCAESLCCGTPVVGFKAGAPEQIALKKYSEFVEYGDIITLEKCVNKWLTRNIKEKKEIGDIASKYYSKEKMCEGYLNLYET